MDKFWERYITSRPAPGSSKGAFDAFAAAHRDSGPRNMYAGGQLVRNTVDGSRPGYAGKKLETGKVGVTIDGKQYRKITHPGHPKFGKISLITTKNKKN